jgi:hypothetical protein
VSPPAVPHAPPLSRRRILALIGLLVLAALAAAGLAGGLVSGSGAAGKDTGRPVTSAEADLLAHARLANLRDGQVSLHAVIHAAAGAVQLTGWVDWARPLVYLNSAADRPGPADGLVQAVPGLVAVRAGRYPTAGVTPATGAAGVGPVTSAAGPPVVPPPVAPVDGWRVRPMNPTAGASAFDGLLALLFSLSRAGADNPATITGRTTVRDGQLAGDPVTIFAGPALSGATPGTSPAPAAQASTMPPVTGTVQYWLDRAGRIRRVVADLGDHLPVQVDFDRGTAQPFARVAMLGGAPVTPRPLTEQELRLVSRMRQRDRESGGGRAALTLPVGPAGLTTATGWLDWRTAVGWLAVRNPDDPGQDQLARVDRDGLTTRTGAAAGDPPGRAPVGDWHFSAWRDRGDAAGATDLDILLKQSVTVTDTRADSLESLRAGASFLRTDTVAGVPVLVVEVRQVSEAGATPGTGRLRYWLDQSGLLRRIEVRTRLGGFGWLELTPAAVPALPDPSTSP